MITIRLKDASGPTRVGTIDELRAAIALPHDAPHPVVWVDLSEPTFEEEELILREAFDFHPLSIEDCRSERVNPRRGDHLPKVEDYQRYVFSIVNPIDLVERVTQNPAVIQAVLLTRQINTFLGEWFIVTHHYEPSRAIGEAMISCDKNPYLLERGPDYVYHLMLDEVVNMINPILDAFDEMIDDIEEEIFSKPTPDTLTRILTMKRSIFRLRRVSVYQREMVYRLSRGEFPLITENEVAYYRNVFDHLVRAADLAESYRDILTGLLDAYLSTTNNRMSEIMKVLTIFSTFFLPLTFIAGVYGMNFDILPELHWKYGYAFAWAMMLGVAGAMFAFFRRKKWL